MPALHTNGCDAPNGVHRRSDAHVSTIDGQPLNRFPGPSETSSEFGQPQPQLGPVGVRPTPLPKRSKGRWFIGGLLLAMIAFALYSGWDAFFRHPVRGEVAGRVIHVPAPWPGVMRTVHVHEGDDVSQGQLLVTIASLDLEQRLGEIKDELQIGQAELAAKVAELKWESELRGDRRQQAAGDYYQLWGQLLMERAKLAQAESQWTRLKAMQDENPLSVSARQIETAKFSHDGLLAESNKLEKAVAELRKRAASYVRKPLDAAPRIKPQLLRIEKLQRELARIREQLKQGEIRSPVNGRVIGVDRFTGEHIKPTDAIVRVVEAGALEAVLYTSESFGRQLEKAEYVDINIAELSDAIRCEVVRCGESLSPAPKHLQRYYRSQQLLAQIHVRPTDRQLRLSHWKLGGEVRLIGWGPAVKAAATSTME